MRSVLRLLVALVSVSLLTLGAMASPALAAGLTITSPADGSQGDDSPTAVTGTADPGVTVHVSIDGSEVGASVASAEGAWSVTLTAELPRGTQTDIVAQVLDETGTPVEVAVAAYYRWADPPTVSVTEPSDGQLVGAQPEIRGLVTGLPEELTYVSADAAPDGTCTVTTTVPEGTEFLCYGLVFESGTHSVTVTATDSYGRSGTATRSFVVDADGPGPVEELSPPFGSTIRSVAPVFSGRGVPGAPVRMMYEGSGDPIADTTVRPDGAWSMVPSAESWSWLADRLTTIEVYVFQADEFGNEDYLLGTYVVDLRPVTPTTTATATATTTAATTTQSSPTASWPSSASGPEASLPDTGQGSGSPRVAGSVTVGFLLLLAGVALVGASRLRRPAGRYAR